MTVSVAVNADYGFVVLAAVAVTLQYVSYGFAQGPVRKRLGVDYPDNGEGRYAAKLTDKAWVEFMNHQRVHYQYMENIGSIIPQILISGLFYPYVTTGLSVLWIVARSFYSRGYIAQGAKGRIQGAKLGAPAFLGMALTSVVGAVKLLGWL